MAAAGVLVLLSAGCGEPPWKQADPAATATPDTTTASPTPTPSASKSAAVRNDLSKGSLKRKLTAGGISLAVNYYSTLSLDKWTPAATKPLTVAASGSFPDGSKQDIYLSNVQVRIDVAGSEGALEGPEPLVDQATVSPGYLIKSPSAYGEIFTIPSLPEQARSVTLNITYQLLAPTAPKSKTFFKQSTNDTITIALADGP